MTAPGRLAVLGVGYADGFPRSLSGRGSVVLHGYRLPIVGRVSMDLTTVDISNLPEGLVQPGDHAELIGPTVSIDDVATDAGTIAYEILTNLGRRYERTYRS
jgi:alanine racemase